ncbi:hypothetical protein [Frigoriflavimonas asaccharolytica]|uniref:Uncharacterized protein n=1 Tax=Frigoriflavimonas asaccharolytica TaxID=2735899 RepID=A0A8J8G663_9FLAO|nr:hypothetical protein [Frigoriflavimonas asaccharolytica]NRS91974.1 hypothetical protein [Frigoriflavimonas asaccharolytica]
MRAYLHLYNEQKENSIMYQVLSYDINIDEGEVFEYSEEIFNELDIEAQKLFHKSNLKIGNYKVTHANIEKNGYWGELRILHLRPI